MVKELSYSTISYVVDTWELAKQKPAFDEIVGSMIMKRLFQQEPRTKTVFGFSAADDFETCKRAQIALLIHSKRMIFMLDAAMSMLGPDADLLTEVLSGLGKRHIQYGVKAAYMPYMGVAIIGALRQVLGENVWNSDIEEAWSIVYEELSTDIMKAILNGREKNLDDLPDTTELITTRVL
eukprot:CAMPEP_0172440488 /NCGR_PEP_ID=MMETSP1065-20121228/1107_1 /TAXON_ID=265537 /ORGANISM="Amphiprora paludosa, Strain CCMP125" /LENGTH=179 /DNA_ID=CAMNT_0013189335 /DNA_START=314 /DNA_END=853 /DNA_ORIENTATION=-